MIQSKFLISNNNDYVFVEKSEQLALRTSSLGTKNAQTLRSKIAPDRVLETRGVVGKSGSNRTQRSSKLN